MQVLGREATGDMSSLPLWNLLAHQSSSPQPPWSTSPGYQPSTTLHPSLNQPENFLPAPCHPSRPANPSLYTLQMVLVRDPITTLSFFSCSSSSQHSSQPKPNQRPSW